MNEAAVWTKKKSQMNLGTDFTATIYRFVSVWKTEQPDFDREYRVWREGGGWDKSKQTRCAVGHTAHFHLH